MPSTQQFFAFSGVRQIGQTRFTQLQPSPVESIRAIHIDGAPYVVHVVQNKRSAIEQHGTTGIPSEEAIRQFIGGDGLSPLEYQLSLQRVVFGARTRWEADGLHFAAFRRGQLVLMKVVMMMKMMVVTMNVG